LLARLAKTSGGHSPSSSGDLHESLVGRTIGAEEDCEASHAFAPDHGDLNAAIVLSVRHNGSKPTVGKIDMLNDPVTSFKLARDRQHYLLKMRSQQIKIRLQEPRQNLVPYCALKNDAHVASSRKRGQEHELSPSRLRPGQ